MPEEQAFDFIVVSGGSTGCALTNRLRENGWRHRGIDLGRRRRW